MLQLPADSDRISRLAAVAACVIAGALCAWFVVRLIWQLVPHSADVASPVPISAPANVQTAATSIAQWHLFGNPQAIDLAARARNAPKTALDLVLRGTFALPDPKQGIAIIADGPHGENNYNVGDTVAGATLLEVYPDHVVLNHDGASESLSLPRPDDHASSAKAGAPARVPGQASSVPPGYVPNARAPQSAAATAGNSSALTRATAADLARDVRFEPIFDNGHIAGARLSGSGAAAALMSQVGLRPTDVVTAVNGTQLANVSNPQQIIDQLGNASSLQVTIQRDGHPATLTLNLR